MSLGSRAINQGRGHGLLAGFATPLATPRDRFFACFPCYSSTVVAPWWTANAGRQNVRTKGKRRHVDDVLSPQLKLEKSRDDESGTPYEWEKEPQIQYTASADLALTLQSMAQAVQGVEQQHTRALAKKQFSYTDHMLEKGPAAYDWRVPLLQLKKATKALEAPSEASVLEDGRDGIDSIKQPEGIKNLRLNVTRYRSIRADDIPQPRVWTSQTLEQYVYDLTHSSVPRMHERNLYGDTTDHRNAVRERLIETLRHPSRQSLISHNAVHVAMLFFGKHSFAKDVKRLFNMMAGLQIRPTKDTFNIILKDVGGKRNLSAFTRILNLMVRMKLSPDEMTWFHFMCCLESKLVKSLVLEHMKKQNLLRKPPVIRLVATHLAPIDLENLLQAGASVAEFMEQYDKTFGPGWFCRSAANSMCKILGAHGQVSKAISVLELMTERGCNPDETTLNIFLELHKRVGDLDGALQIAESITSTSGTRLKEPAFDVLLTLAWKNGFANVCRVLWRVACATAQVSHRMQLKVMKGMTWTYEPERSKLSDQRILFYKYRSKIVAGINKKVDWQDAWKHVSDTTEQGNRSDFLTQLAKTVRDDDLDASVRFRFGGDIFLLLEKALQKDKKWAERVEVQQGDLEWMAKNAIDVPLLRKA